MAPIPPFLRLGQLGPAGLSSSECSERLFHFSFSCCSSSGSPALYPCQRKTTAVPSPTILPGHSTPCSDTQMALLPSERSRCYLQQRWEPKDLAKSNPKLAKRGPESWQMPSVWQLSLSSMSHVCKYAKRQMIHNDRRRANRR